MKFLFTLLVSLFALNISAQVSDYLMDKINKEHPQKVNIIIVLKDQWDSDFAIENMKQNHIKADQRIKMVISEVRKFTKEHQKSILASIKSIKQHELITDVVPFWCANIIAATVSPEALFELSKNSSVGQIIYDAPGYAYYPVHSTRNVVSKDTSEIGLNVIKAPFLWKLGYTGKGRIALGIDTGVFPDHPAFTNRFLGNYLPLSQCWYGYNGPVPYDVVSSTHGTHTMGTTLGYTTSWGDTIGVAFKANFIASDPIVGNMNEVRKRSEIMQAFQWALDPDNNPETTNDVPDAINNSWGLTNSDNPDNCNLASTLVLNTVNAAGIAVIFSAGNDGAGAGTIGEPAHIARSTTNVFSIGAISSSNLAIAGFSSRGPTNCYSGEDTSLLIKPEVVAPGVNVLSSISVDDYGTLSGTSMASPHVTGSVLLLKEAFPDVSGVEILETLYQTATQLGVNAEDNTFGRGLINIEAAYNYLLQTHTAVPPIGNFPDAYGYEYDKYNVLNGDSCNIKIHIKSDDSTVFNITGVILKDNGQVISPNYSIIDSGAVKIINLNIVKSDLVNGDMTRHLITGMFSTDIDNDMQMNNNFWFKLYVPEIVDLPYLETFENAKPNFDSTLLFVENPDNKISWRTDTIAGFETNKRSAAIQFIKYNDFKGAKDILHLPYVNIENADNPKLSFSYSYVKKTYDIYKDSLIVTASYYTDMLHSDTLFALGGADLATVSGNIHTDNFVPTSFQQWKDTTINISNYIFAKHVQINFIAVNDNGNNLYVDNLAVHEGDNPLSDNEISTPKSKITIFPNPTKSVVYINNLSRLSHVLVFDITGKLVSQISNYDNSDIKLNTSTWSNGTYIIKIQSQNGLITKHVIKY